MSTADCLLLPAPTELTAIVAIVFIWWDCNWSLPLPPPPPTNATAPVKTNDTDNSNLVESRKLVAAPKLNSSLGRVILELVARRNVEFNLLQIGIDIVVVSVVALLQLTNEHTTCDRCSRPAN